MASSIETLSRKGLIGTTMLLSGLAVASCAGPYYDDTYAYGPGYGYDYAYGYPDYYDPYYYGPFVGFEFEGRDHRHRFDRREDSADRFGERRFDRGEQRAVVSRGDNRAFVGGNHAFAGGNRAFAGGNRGGFAGGHASAPHAGGGFHGR